MTTESDNTSPQAAEREPDQAESTEAAASDQGSSTGEPELLEEYAPPTKPKLVAEEEAAADAEPGES